MTCLSIGYAAFSTGINLTAKGNISTTPSSCFTISDNGDDTGTITDYDADACGTKVKIPSKINNLIITKIGGAVLNDTTNTYFKSFARKKIKTVIFPDTIEEIGLAAFDQNQISKLVLPDSIKKIGNVAFRHNNISELTMPNHYVEMGISVFNDNKMPDEKAFIYKQNTDGSYDKTTITSYAGIRTENITIPSTVKTLDAWSFRALSSTNFNEIIIPDNVTIIKYEAIQWDRYLKNVVIGNGVKTIEYYALAYNYILETVSIGSGIETMSTTTFANCPELKTITINRKEDAVAGAPWGATNATVNWTGTN